MTREPNPEKDRQETIAYLQHEQPVWLKLRDRCDRTANLDRQLTNQRDDAMNRLNGLLEGLFAQTMIIEFIAIEGVGVGDATAA